MSWYYRPIPRGASSAPDLDHPQPLAGAKAVWFDQVHVQTGPGECETTMAAALSDRSLARLSAARPDLCGLTLDRPRIMGILNVTPDSFSDGVRGLANSTPMTAEIALKLGAAAGRYFRRDGRNNHRVVIGKDTRLSGYMIENALTAGLTSTGMNVLLLGPVPTPAVGHLTHSMRADLGIMISASHNPFHDNGIKLFGPDGFKLSDEGEMEIEAL
ncbi:MAG: hypothetical protein P8X69_10060, partial [Maritimibacter sp.]